MEDKENVKISPRTGKPMMKPRGGNSPVIGNNGLMTQPGDNAKIIAINLKLLNLPNIDLDDVEAVVHRLGEYFQIYAESDFKPTVAGMAIALNGHSRTWLWGLVHDKPIGGRGNEINLRPEVTDFIKKAYFMMENQWETYMNSGKINPMAGVFLGVNNYSYRDVKQVDVVPVVQPQQDADYTVEEIRGRYLTDSASDSGDS